MIALGPDQLKPIELDSVYLMMISTSICQPIHSKRNKWHTQQREEEEEKKQMLPDPIHSVCDFVCSPQVDGIRAIKCNLN